MAIAPALFSSATVEWPTPKALYAKLHGEFNFNFDPCPYGGSIDGTATLFNSWRERAFCSSCGLNWGVTEDVIALDHETRDLYPLSQGQASNAALLRTSEESEERVGFLVQGLPAGEIASQASSQASGSDPAREGDGGKESPSARRCGAAQQALVFSNRQSSSASEAPSVSLVPSGLGEMQTGLESSVCLLREAREANSGSCDSFVRSELPRHSSRKHPASLPSVQSQETPFPIGSVAKRYGPPCPHCGVPTERKNLRVFVNPPYGPGLRAFLERWHEPQLAVYLIPARTDVRWFHEIVLPNAKEIRFVKGRLKFGDATSPAPFPSMIVIFRKD